MKLNLVGLDVIGTLARQEIQRKVRSKGNIEIICIPYEAGCQSLRITPDGPYIIRYSNQKIVKEGLINYSQITDYFPKMTYEKLTECLELLVR